MKNELMKDGTTKNSFSLMFKMEPYWNIAMFWKHPSTLTYNTQENQNSEYQVNMIPFYEYVFLVQGISRFDYQNSVVAKNRDMGLCNVPWSGRLATISRLCTPTF